MLGIDLDLDGVVADFVSASCEFHGRPLYAATTWNFYENWGYTDEDFWHPIRRLGTCFYEHHVKPYPWANDLINVVKSIDPDFVVVTVAGGGHAGDYAGKVLWVRKHIGKTPVIVVPDGYKQRLASPRRVLIDDSDKNVETCRAAGGHAILFPQPWNNNHSLSGVAERRIEYVADCLATFQRDKAA